MSIDLNLTAINLDRNNPNYSGDEYVALMANLQGNIVKPHGRDSSTHLFLAFNTQNIAAVKTWINEIVLPMVTSAGDQAQQSKNFRATGQDAGLFANFALSAAGYAALGLSKVPDDPSYLRGMQHPADTNLGLNDPPVSSWEAGFQKTSHALVLLAADDPQDVAKAASKIAATGQGIVTVLTEQPGAVFRNDKGQVIEHFGFADGISQPLFMADDIERARMNGGLDKYDPSAPLGNVLAKDPNGGPLAFGSYLVFRKLSQNVRAFRQQEAELATTLKLPPDKEELAGAYLVGRFRDGTPVVAQSRDGWTSLPDNFNYDADADGMRCPFHAHIRKTNPRGDKLREFGLPPGEDRSRRLARRAVSYGPLTLDPPPGADVGLLFMCVQNSIVNQFEFMQAIWSNFTQFLREGTGLDPVIGQGVPGAAPVAQKFPQTWGLYRDGTQAFNFVPCVDMRGGEYFFLPSMECLRQLASIQ